MHQLSRDELQRFLERNRINFTSLDLDGFRDWLRMQIEQASNQPLFTQRCRIREIRRRHRRRLRDREKRLELATHAYEASETFDRVQYLSRELADIAKAIDGLTQAAEQRPELIPKLRDYREKHRVMEVEYRTLERSSPEKKRFHRAETSMQNLLRETGLAQAEDKLESIAIRQGNRSSAAGENFEEEASLASRQLIIPDLSRPGQAPVLLHGLTLGCARGEIDQMIVTRDGTSAVEVQAIVEAKKNINDLVHGFRVRQENLAWFTGDSTMYNSELYETQQFPTGHFDSPAIHQENGQSYFITSKSFSRFTVDPDVGYRLDSLYFMTRKRELVGVTMQELGRILHRVATDPGFDLESDVILRRLMKWALSFVEPFQTEDVLTLYSKSDELARQIVFC